MKRNINFYWRVLRPREWVAEPRTYRALDLGKFEAAAGKLNSQAEMLADLQAMTASRVLADGQFQIEASSPSCTK